MSNARLTQAAQRIAQAFHLGGASWTVTSPATGVGGTPTSGGTVAGYVTEYQERVAQAAPGTPTTVSRWRFTPTAGGSLPMTGWTVATPIGAAAPLISSTFPTFGAFLVTP